MDSSRSADVPDSPAGVLAAARTRRAEADRAEAELVGLAVAWAVMHPAESIDDAETVSLRGFGDTPIPVAGPGAPLVAEFAAAVGLPTEAGKRYLGQAVELRYRLPRLWARVTAGDLAAWRAGGSPNRRWGCRCGRRGSWTGTWPRSPTRPDWSLHDTS